MMQARHHLADLRADPTTPPVVLVPGIDGTALLFYRQQPLLAQAFDVVAFPLPGDPGATMDDLVDDLRKVVSEVSDDGAILVGESFGGALAMSTALAHPEIVRGLVVINSFPWFHQRARLWASPRLLRIMPWAAMPVVRTFTESRLHSEHALEQDLAEFHDRSRAIDRQGYVRRLEILGSYDIRPRLGEIDAPCLFLAADQDRLVPSVYWGRYMSQGVPQGSLTVLEGYGHVCLINHDLDLLEHIGPWWEEVVASP